MAIKIIYFPHGTTSNNSNQISSGWFDVELSEMGINESIKLKEHVRDEAFDVVFCSDLKRSTDSAKLTFEGVVPIVLDERLRECNYGRFNGQSSWIVAPMKLKAVREKFPDGESYEDVKARIDDFLKFLKKHYDGKSVAIVAHQATQLSLDVLLKGKTWEEAFAEDWREANTWQPGWQYILN
jgi:broad specificity phosphatase PhoE